MSSTSETLISQSPLPEGNSLVEVSKVKAKAKKVPQKQVPKVKQPRALAAEDRQLQKLFLAADLIDVNVEGDEEDEEWTIDMSEAAMVARRQDALKQGVLGNLAAGTMEEDALLERMDKIVHKEGATLAQRVQSMQELQQKEAFGTKRMAELLFKLFFTPEAISESLGKLIRDSKAYITEFCDTQESQQVLLGNLEQLTVRHSLVASFKDTLFALYDSDILDEDTLIQWYDFSATDFIEPADLAILHQAAQPFIEWLMADSEED